ncbi:hypothetical protein E2C01_102219 [Portunus trituberculatus]|uniref:Uncharacterized protein n=1 Tax=Portunus trituberculatus TaxID=210409 RepID=A0A5B7KNP6_PORTR|nr:hypothetical protein [Portunus trituberculatus]
MAPAPSGSVHGSGGLKGIQCSLTVNKEIYILMERRHNVERLHYIRILLKGYCPNQTLQPSSREGGSSPAGPVPTSHLRLLTKHNSITPPLPLSLSLSLPPSFR